MAERQGQTAKGTTAAIQESVARFPHSRGVYIMKDAAGQPVYIGKAADLRSRVRSYFTEGPSDRIQVPALMTKVRSIEWIATSNETEALILEANLVRTHKPHYNIDLKDDKHYPYLKVTLNEPFPRLLVVRRAVDDGGRYFGPFTDASNLRRVTALARKAFRIRDCNRPLPLKQGVRPCLNHEIGRCSGLCSGKITREEYLQNNVSLLLNFLGGKQSDVVDQLRQQMEKASQNLEYEKAAELRDQMQLVASAAHSQKVDLRTADLDRDVFGVHDNGGQIYLCALSFRQGILLSTRHFAFRREAWDCSAQNRDSIIVQFYQTSVNELPAEILLPQSMGFESEPLKQWFFSQRGRSVEVSMPQRGDKAALIELAAQNAALYCVQRTPADGQADVADLKSALSLPRLPRSIEAFDISNLGESFCVAGMVRFEDGRPQKSGYRRFKIKTVAGQNDFAMLMEAVSRRLRRLAAQNKPSADMLLIDGGKGQLHAAMEPLREFSHPPMIAALAKEEEVLFSPYADGAVRLAPTRPARKLVQRIRDEAHRFAHGYHLTIRDKQFGRSSLEDIAGVGPQRSARLLKKFGSLARLKSVSAEEIATVNGITIELARAIKNTVG